MEKEKNISGGVTKDIQKKVSLGGGDKTNSRSNFENDCPHGTKPTLTAMSDI